MSTALVDHYAASGIVAAELPLDYFLIDRETRQEVFRALEAGEIDTSLYSHAAWEQDKYRAFLLAARTILLGKTAITERLVIPDAYNRFTGKCDEEKTIHISANSIIVTEGVGLHAYHDKFFDVCIRTDVRDDSILISRVLAREHQKPASAPRLPEGYLEWRYNLVDSPHTTYLREASAGSAEIVVDTSRFKEMIVYKMKNAKGGM